MGEAKRRGTYEERKQEAINAGRTKPNMHNWSTNRLMRTVGKEVIKDMLLPAAQAALNRTANETQARINEELALINDKEGK